jgi:hypothetical protein
VLGAASKPTAETLQVEKPAAKKKKQQLQEYD